METSISRHRDPQLMASQRVGCFEGGFFCQPKKKTNKLIFKLPPKQHMLQTRGFVLGSVCSPKTCFFLRIFLLDVPHQPPFFNPKKDLPGHSRGCRLWRDQDEHWHWHTAPLTHGKHHIQSNTSWDSVLLEVCYVMVLVFPRTSMMRRCIYTYNHISIFTLK